MVMSCWCSSQDAVLLGVVLAAPPQSDMTWSPGEAILVMPVRQALWLLPSFNSQQDVFHQLSTVGTAQEVDLWGHANGSIQS